jgi:hypothetical protein
VFHIAHLGLSCSRHGWLANRLPAVILLNTAWFLAALAPGQLRAEFILLDNFNSGTLGGALSTSNPAWSANAIFTVATDPTNPVNRVGSAVQASAGTNQFAVLPFGAANVIANGTTGTVFFRMMRGPTAATNFFGYVKSSTTLATAGRRSGIGSAPGSTQPMVMLSSSSSAVTTPGFTNLNQDTWYRFWVVMDNAADTFEIYSQREGTSPLSQTLLSNSVGSTQNFMDGSTADALQSLLFAQTSASADMAYYFDDIYIDPTASNLAVPPIVVPEPSTILLGAVGLATLATIQSLRRRQP